MKWIPPSGTQDWLPPESQVLVEFLNAARLHLTRFGYQEIITPIFEAQGLFIHSLGNSSEIVQKQMFTFADRGGRPMALRPEGTAGVVRAYLTHGLDKRSGVTKLSYMGPMFRAERPQRGRFREFQQIGAECFGIMAPSADAEIILLAWTILKDRKIPSLSLEFNTVGCPQCRPAYQEALKKYLKNKTSLLCSDCRERIKRNPLRVLDFKKDDTSLQDAPTPLAYACSPCQEHLKTMQKLLEAVGLGSHLVFSPRLVRGLDYYTRTVFEITTPLAGAQNALAAGGRYDNLVQLLGGPSIPAVGFALGVERTLQVEQENRTAGALSPQDVPQNPLVFVVVLGEQTWTEGFKLVSDLRAKGWRVEGLVPEKSLKAQLRLANGLSAQVALILGEDEQNRGEVLIRDLKASVQISVKRGEILLHLDQIKRGQSLLQVKP